MYPKAHSGNTSGLRTESLATRSVLGEAIFDGSMQGREIISANDLEGRVKATRALLERYRRKYFLEGRPEVR